METQRTLSFETTSPVDENSCRFVFKELVDETIDDVFSSLGTVCKQAIYRYLEEKCGLKREDFADHMMEFCEALERLFGDAAALLEIQMMRILCLKVPQFKHRPEGAPTLHDYVNALEHFVGVR